MQDLSENNNIAELTYVCYMMFVIMKSRKPSTQYGNLVERRATENIKDTLIKDTYSVFCYGEGSINSFPKNLFKADHFTQTGLSIDFSTATLEDLNVFKTQLLQKVAEVKRLSKCINLTVCLLPLLVMLILGLSAGNNLALPKSFELGP